MQGKDTKHNAHSTFLVLSAFTFQVVCRVVRLFTYHWRAPNKICLTVRLPVTPSARNNSRKIEKFKRNFGVLQKFFE